MEITELDDDGFSMSIILSENRMFRNGNKNNHNGG